MTNETQQARRAAFEAWYVTDCADNAQITITQEEVSKLRGKHGDYRERAALHGKWVGFNAALDSLVIELPNRYSDACAETSPLSRAYNDAFDRCRDAIHAAGVKTR